MTNMKPVAVIPFLILALVYVQCVNSAKQWALLAATAKDWPNYGMQADALHAYQIVKEGGIPDEQIVLMMYDDIADNELNPFKGEVFQSYDLKDVYGGAPKDYTGEEATKETFLAVLRGDRQRVKALTGRNGKVIDSGPDDNVFVFISDHGVPGHVCWWDLHDMSALELNETIQNMHERNRYNNMVLYIDTCYSGSMFQNILPDNIGVYAVTAANATQYSYSSDCSSDSFTGFAHTCLGGLFSINWVYEAESDDRAISTLDQQFGEAAIACGRYSSPMQFGDLSIALKPQADFFGNSSENSANGSRRPRRSSGARSTMPKHMMAYQHLKNRLLSLAEDSEEFRQVRDELNTVETRMSQVDQLMKDLSTRVYGHPQHDRATREFGLINWDCYEPLLEAVRVECPGMTSREEVKHYALAQFGVLVNLCNDAPTGKVLAALKDASKVSPLCKLQ